MKDVVLIWGSFFVAGALFSLWERVRSAHRVLVRERILFDVGAFLVVFAFFLVVGIFVNISLPFILASPVQYAIEHAGITKLPIWARLTLFYLVWDFSMYSVHWLMHRKPLWPTHRWHHAPKEVYWFVGVRGSLPHIIITFLPFLWFYFFALPVWLAVVVSMGSVVGNAWMHVNIKGDWMRWIEFFFVTPRFHRIHHSERPEHYSKNLGSLFSFWDRLFGTYVNPDTVEDETLRFGIGRDVHPVRLAIGV